MKPARGGEGTGNSAGGGGVTWEVEVEASRGNLRASRLQHLAAVVVVAGDAAESMVAQRNADPANPNKFPWNRRKKKQKL
jgi:hypothetical protein